MHSFAGLLWRQAPVVFSVCLILSFASSGCALYLFTLFTRGWHGAAAPPFLLIFLLVGVVCSTTVVVPVLMVRATRQAVETIRLRLLQNIMHAPLHKLELIGSAALLESLTQDIPRLAAALPGNLTLVRDLTFVVIGLGFLIWLAPVSSAISIVLLIVVGLGSFLLRRTAARYEQALSPVRERLLSVFLNLLSGIKDLKVRSTVRGSIRACSDELELVIRKGLVKESLFASNADAAMTAAMYLALTTAAFGTLDSYASDRLHATHIAILIVTVLTLRNALAAGQSFRVGRAALNRIEGFTRQLAALPVTEQFDDAGYGDVPPPPVGRLLFNDVRYRYGSGSEFQFGPVNFELRSGEILLVTGSNGTGKTTFVKLLTGLYETASGTIEIDGHLVSGANQGSLSKYCSAVFYDFCLFECLSDTSHDLSPADATCAIRNARLDDVVRADSGVLAQAKHFSGGQRRRVALVLSLLQDRSIFVFDEFAADQDPQLRRYFYEQLVPQLCSRGKIVVVVSHDDRFFEAADATLHLERFAPPVFTRRESDGIKRPCSTEGAVLTGARSQQM